MLLTSRRLCLTDDCLAAGSLTTTCFTHAQVTAFVALLALDTRRLEQRRIDCLPCLRIPYLDEEGTWVHDDLSEDDADTPLYDSYPAASGASPGDAGDGVRGSGGGGGRDYGAGDGVGQEDGLGGRRLSGAARVAAAARSRPSLQGLLQLYMERVHAPALVKPLVQVVVIAVFVTGELRRVMWLETYAHVADTAVSILCRMHSDGIQ